MRGGRGKRKIGCQTGGSAGGHPPCATGRSLFSLFQISYDSNSNSLKRLVAIIIGIVLYYIKRNPKDSA